MVAMEYMLPHQVHTEYTTRLRARQAEGVFVSPAQVSIGEWAPRANQCHENVTVWCTNDQAFQIVRGWLYLDLAGRLPYEIFLAHSVVRDKDGALWDITPLQALERYPFIAATESEAEYAAFVEQGAGRLLHYK